MKITLLQVPYHLGSERVGMGRAPARYLEAGADRRLREAGHEVDIVTVERGAPFAGELRAIIDVNVALSRAVREATDRGSLPVVAGGNCNVALGIMAGLSADRTGVVWFDAHGDFNTPETTPSGFIDGMPLAMCTGLCYRDEVWGALGGACVPETHAVHAGGRDLDPGERRNFEASRVTVVPALQLAREGPAEALRPALQRLRGGARPTRGIGEVDGVDRVYVHVDLDVLDPAYAPAVDFAAPGGLTPSELLEAIGLTARHLRVSAISLTAYDPEVPDPDERTLRTSLDLLVRFVELVAAA